MKAQETDKSREIKPVNSQKIKEEIATREFGHQSEVLTILQRNGALYTPERGFPSSVIAEHSGTLGRFSQSFYSVIQKMKNIHNKALHGGYATEGDGPNEDEKQALQ